MEFFIFIYLFIYLFSGVFALLVLGSVVAAAYSVKCESVCRATTVRVENRKCTEHFVIKKESRSEKQRPRKNKRHAQSITENYNNSDE